MRSTLSGYGRIVVSNGNEGHKSSAALAVTIITLEVGEWLSDILGWRMARKAWFSCNQDTLGRHLG